MSPGPREIGQAVTVAGAGAGRISRTRIEEPAIEIATAASNAA